jgi:ADP-heptose:LPS heptosyltransferase
MAKRSVGYSEYRYAGGLQGKFSPRLYDATVRHNDDQHAVSIVGDILKPLGVSFKPKALVPLYCDPKSKEKVDGLLARNGINPAKDVIVGIHPFAAANVAWRAWPRERFVELIERIKKENDCRVILTGQPTGGIDRPAEILAGLSDRTGVYYFNGLGTADLFCLIKNYDLMVSIDTGPMHIAAAQGVKTIGLFGPKPPERSGPFPLEEHVCFHHKYDKCEHPTVYEATACMKCRSEYIKLITVDEVFAAVKKSLKKKR